MSYNRYTRFSDGKYVNLVPFIKIPKRHTDYYVYYELGKTRLDLLSYEYYGDANYGWLILQANPELGGLEYMIPNNALIRIPYPLNSVLNQYDTDAKLFIETNGLE